MDNPVNEIATSCQINTFHAKGTIKAGKKNRNNEIL